MTAPASWRVSPVAAGLALTLASAVLYSWLGVLSQLAFDVGASVGTVLSGRFLLAAGILWLLVSVLRPRRPDRRQVLAGLLLGVAMSAHAWLFSTSLTRLDAGLVDLLLFTYPALVMLGAVALRRERWSARRALALGTVTAGTAFVLLGGLHNIDALGVLLALGSAVAYTAYILTSAGQLERTDPFLFTALVATGAAAVLTVGGAAQNDVSFEVGATVLAFIGALGLVAIAGMVSFVEGISRLGPSRASIISAVQPALTPVVGFAVFADRLAPPQMFGGGLVIAGVVILEARGRPFDLGTEPSLLPRRERWTLARLTGAMDVPAGRRLVRQGAPGDAFFLIQRGRASVNRNHEQIADLGPGDFFGELALLGAGERTASVVAATDMRIRVVPERRFARAMRRLPTLARSVRDVASERVVAGPSHGRGWKAGGCRGGLAWRRLAVDRRCVRRADARRGELSCGTAPRLGRTLLSSRPNRQVCSERRGAPSSTP
jgi:drug/metabolite transporter (DMT)-like permease